MTKRRRGGISGKKDWAALTRSEKVEYQRLLDDIAAHREGAPRLRLGKRRLRSAKKLVGSVVRQDRKGRIAVASADRLYRRMTVITLEGPKLVEVRGSRVASLVGKHANAVRKFVETGDARDLRQFRGKSVGGQRLAADPKALRQLAQRGEVEFEDIYDLTV